MKRWKGYLTAGIVAALTVLLHVFCATHTILVDMVYPYGARLIQTTLADKLGGGSVGLWYILVLIFLVAVVLLFILVKKTKGSVVAFFGWVLAFLSIVFFLQTGIFSLNRYTGGLQEDMRLTLKEYSVSELEEATTYFRDRAEAVRADAEEKDFAQLAEGAAKGFDAMQYDKADSVFAGSRVKVKKLIPGSLLAKLFGDTGRVTPLTGEAYVNYMLPSRVLPWGICYQMSYRMSIVGSGSTELAAFLVCKENPDAAFQYSAYLMAYRYCLKELMSMNNATAKAAVDRLTSGCSSRLSADAESCDRYLTSRSDTVTFLVCWYLQDVVLPGQTAGENSFDPLDASQVDISDIVGGR